MTRHYFPLEPGDIVEQDFDKRLRMGDRIRASKGGVTVEGKYYAQDMGGTIIFQDERHGHHPLFELRIQPGEDWEITFLESGAT